MTLTQPLPGAGKRQPEPIPFPSFARADGVDIDAVHFKARQRANENAVAWQAQRTRMDTLIRAARVEGHDQGHRAGYIDGVHWGIVCGGAAGALVVGAIWIVTLAMRIWA